MFRIGNSGVESAAGRIQHEGHGKTSGGMCSILSKADDKQYSGGKTVFNSTCEIMVRLLVFERPDECPVLLTNCPAHRPCTAPIKL